MQRYDAMYIVAPTVEEEARKALVAELKALFENAGANNFKVSEWGTRKLAYEIEDFKEGYYVDMEFDLDDNTVIAEFDRLCNIKETVLRHIVVKLPKAQH